MADAEVHLEIGPQYVEAAKQVVEKAVAPFRNVGEYRIGVDAELDYREWVYVQHETCGMEIYSGSDDPEPLMADRLLALIKAHRCEKGDDHG